MGGFHGSMEANTDNQSVHIVPSTVYTHATDIRQQSFNVKDPFLAIPRKRFVRTRSSIHCGSCKAIQADPSGFGDISSTMLFGSFQACVTYLFLSPKISFFFLHPCILEKERWVKTERVGLWKVGRGLKSKGRLWWRVKRVGKWKETYFVWLPLATSWCFSLWKFMDV